jgi:hypothetical protein
MHRLLICLIVLCIHLGLGCGGSPEAKKDDQRGGAAPERCTLDNVARIQQEQMNYAGVCQVLAGSGESTNEDRPGLMPGNKYVWKEGNKKVYVSFNPLDGKANGVSWEGFGGK